MSTIPRRARAALASCASMAVLVASPAAASTITVLAHDLRAGTSVVHNRRMTVSLPPLGSKAGKALAGKTKSMAIGDQVTLTGGVTGSGRTTRFDASGVLDRATPFHVYLGTVSAINASIVSVTKGAKPSDDDHERDTGPLTVDIADAAVSIDAGATALAPGQTVAVLGSSINDIVVATAVFGVTTAPTVVAGRASDVTGNIVTIDGEADSSTPVDLTEATVIVDGNTNSTPSQITSGSHIITLGTTDPGGTYLPTIAFAFTHTCDSHHHGDGGREQGGPGGGGGHGPGGGGGGH